MKQFMMGGRAVTGPMRYRDCFRPQDLLGSRELAAGFFQQQCRFLSPVAMYHTEMFYFAAFYPEKAYGYASPMEYAGDDWALCSLPEYRQRARLREHFSSPVQRQRLEDLWTLSRASGLPEADWQRLFCLLAAGYGLAGKDLKACPLTPEEAKRAYLRQDAPTAAGEGWLVLDGGGDIVLPARQQPYRILMNQGAAQLLEAGAVITPRRILAAPHRQGSRNVPVTLLLYDGPQDAAPREARIAPGDYRYLNFVGGVPVWLHPVAAQTPACRMERTGGCLVVSGRDGARAFDCSGLKIIGFAPEYEDEGWILLSEYGLDCAAYSHRLTYGASLPEEPIVQVEFRQAECLLLDQRGYVHSNFYPVSKHRVAALEAFRR